MSLPAEGSSLPACEGFLAERSLQQLLTYANNVSNWISAEIIICDSVKVRGEKKDGLDRLLCFDVLPPLFSESCPSPHVLPTSTSYMLLKAT